MPDFIGLFFFLFFKLVRTDSAQRALVILRKLVAFINEAAYGTNEFLHVVFSFYSFSQQFRHLPVKLS